MDVADHADDSAVAVDGKRAADRVVSREVLLRRGLIDDRDGGRARAIAGVEQAALAERNLQRLVIVRRHSPDTQAHDPAGPE